MKKPQYITLLLAVSVLGLLLAFGRTAQKPAHSPGDGHNHSASPGSPADAAGGIGVDSLLQAAKKILSPEQHLRMEVLEKQAATDASREARMNVLHQLAHFWKDTGRTFVPYAWYSAEGARLENSEKSLTFAAQMFLSGMQQQEDPRMKQWMALQSKDLFERSLKLNPDNDSAKVGIGAVYMFGGISAAPMEGILKVREVADRDSTNIYAQMTLAMGSLMSGQLDKAEERLLTVTRIQPANAEAHLLLGDIFERKGNKPLAVHHYQHAAQLIRRADMKTELEQRIAQLKR